MKPKGRGPTRRDKPVYFEDGLILKAGGLGRLLGCCPQTARKVALETVDFPTKKIFGRGIEGWSRLEVEAWLVSPTNPAVSAVGDKEASL